MTSPIDPLQAEVDAARDAYREADARLVSLAGGIWEDGREAADWLIAVAEEQGAERAIHHMLGNLEALGTIATPSFDTLVVDMADPMEETLERILVARDKLDLATGKRDAVMRPGEPKAPLIINFAGREFYIDPLLGEIRSVDNPAERYRLADELVAKHPDSPSKASPTQQLAKDIGITPAEPAPARDKPRSR